PLSVQRTLEIAFTCRMVTASDYSAQVTTITHKAQLSSKTINWSGGTSVEPELRTPISTRTFRYLIGDHMKRISCLLSLLLLLTPFAQTFAAGQKTSNVDHVKRNVAKLGVGSKA